LVTEISALQKKFWFKKPHKAL